MAWLDLGWKEQNGRTAQPGLSCLWLLPWHWGWSQLLDLWPGVMVVTSTCPLLRLVPSSISMGTLKEELSTSPSWMPRRRP